MKHRFTSRWPLLELLLGWVLKGAIFIAFLLWCARWLR
jgi:hypothetical protein